MCELMLIINNKHHYYRYVDNINDIAYPDLSLPIRRPLTSSMVRGYCNTDFHFFSDIFLKPMPVGANFLST